MTIRLLSSALVFLFVSGARADDAPDYPDLARLIQSMVIPQVPKLYEDHSDWGSTIPVTNDVRLQRVRRTVVKVGDRMEFPHGTWKRTKIWLDEPARDVQIRVSELKKIDKQKTRIGLDATVALQGERERQQWVKGLRLLDLIVQADAVVVAHCETEVTVTVNVTKFPPDIKVVPKVVQTKLELKQFELHRVGPVLLGDKEARDLGEELRGSLQDLMRQYEPQVTQKINEAIAKGLTDDKVKLSPATLLKLNLPAAPKE